MSLRILIVDDDKMITEALQEALDDGQTDFDVANDGERALELFKENDYDIALLDLVLPGMNGIEILKKVDANRLSTRFIMMTGFGSIENAIEAMKEGAAEYLTKPVNLEELRLLVGRTKETLKLVYENKQLRELLQADNEPFSGLIGGSVKMLRIKEVILQVAAKKVTILIEGESGTGKEVVANAIFSLSDRHDKPFLKVNCGALSHGLLESELFGHEKGAFTGAINQKKGLFEAASGGIIFLDEVGEMPVELQVKLLRVLETGEFTRVGGIQALKTDVRIIAATNKSLADEVDKGNFREDLFYRLKVITIHLPALRERKEDIPFLIKRFIELYNYENDSSFKGVTAEVVEFLSRRYWKGNIRELRNVIEKILVFAKNDLIEYSDLPNDLIKEDLIEYASNELNGTMAQIEKNVIERTMMIADGNVRRVAVLLDIPVRTLYRKIKSLGIKQVNANETNKD